MQKDIKVLLWDKIKQYMEANGHNTESIQTKAKNPFPICSRSILHIKKGAIGDSAKTFHPNTTKRILDFFGIDYYVDGGVFFIKNKKAAE